MKNLPNAICLAGLAIVLYGLWTLYEPLAWIAGGLLLCCLGVLVLRKT